MNSEFSLAVGAAVATAALCGCLAYSGGEPAYNFRYGDGHYTPENFGYG
jgi:hypothetical protein